MLKISPGGTGSSRIHSEEKPLLAVYLISGWGPAVDKIYFGSASNDDVRDSR